MGNERQVGKQSHLETRFTPQGLCSSKALFTCCFTISRRIWVKPATRKIQIEIQIQIQIYLSRLDVFWVRLLLWFLRAVANVVTYVCSGSGFVSLACFSFFFRPNCRIYCRKCSLFCCSASTSCTGNVLDVTRETVTSSAQTGRRPQAAQTVILGRPSKLQRGEIT